MKKKIDKLDFINIKSIHSPKDTNGQSQNGRKYLQIIYLLKSIIYSRILIGQQ